MARRHAPLFIAPTARIWHEALEIGQRVFIGDRVTIHQFAEGGPIRIAERVDVHCDTVLETGPGGFIELGADTHLQPGCFLSCWAAGIRIGADVEIGPRTMMFPHNHRFVAGIPITSQGVTARGDIVIGDHAWLGAGVIVLGGVTIGEGAVVGAGAVVTRDIPADAIASGVPARVTGTRGAPGAS